MKLEHQETSEFQKAIDGLKVEKEDPNMDLFKDIRNYINFKIQQAYVAGWDAAIKLKNKEEKNED